MPFVKNGDITIYYEVEGKGEPVILLHGGLSNLEDWKDYGYVTCLKKKYQVILVDQRGHGKSDKPHEVECYFPENKISDVLAVMDALDVSDANIFGYSYGARTGLELAKYQPQRVRSLIIGGLGPWGKRRPGSFSILKFLKAFPESWMAFIKQSGPFSKKAREQIRANDFKAFGAMFKAPWPNLAGDLPGMVMPFLVFAGEKDELWQHEEIKEAFSVLDDMTFFSIPDLGHAQSWSRSELVLPQVNEFLARVNP